MTPEEYRAAIDREAQARRALGGLCIFCGAQAHGIEPTCGSEACQRAWIAIPAYGRLHLITCRSYEWLPA